MSKYSLLQYQLLPAEVREELSAPIHMEMLADLEKKYNVQLGLIVMYVATRELAYKDVDQYLIDNFDIEEIKARKIKLRLYNDIFKEIDYFSFIDEGELVESVEEEAGAESEEDLSVDPNVVLAAYRGDPKIQEKIDTEEVDIQNISRGNIESIENLFFEAVQKKRPYRAVAALILIAEQDQLGTFLNTNLKMKQFLSVVWKDRFGDEFVGRFEENSDTPEFIRLFLRYILEDRLEMKAEEAARIGAKIGNIYRRLGKEDYSGVAYYDAQSNGFVWSE